MGERAWVKVAPLAAVRPNDMKGVKVGGRSIAIYNVEGAIYATDDVCTHAFALLSTGFLEGDVVECPLHSGRFDVKTGKALCLPVTDDVDVFPARVVDGEIEIEIAVD